VSLLTDHLSVSTIWVSKEQYMLRILLADHHTHVLRALKTMLLERPEIVAVGEAVDVNGLLSLSEKLLPDLILIDRELPGGPIEDLIAALHQLDPKPYVIIMSSEIEHSRMLLKAGADAFVSKGDQPEWLLDTLLKFDRRIKNEDSSRLE
jgi:DNA-binding NarL/FixJ family response regulator